MTHFCKKEHQVQYWSMLQYLNFHTYPYCTKKKPKLYTNLVFLVQQIWSFQCNRVQPQAFKSRLKTTPGHMPHNQLTVTYFYGTRHLFKLPSQALLLGIHMPQAFNSMLPTTKKMSQQQKFLKTSIIQQRNCKLFRLKYTGGLKMLALIFMSYRMFVFKSDEYIHKVLCFISTKYYF